MVKKILHDDKTFFVHPIYNIFAASEDGSIFNLQRNEIGCSHIETKSGFRRFTAFPKEFVEKGKCYYNHRFIWEAINQIILQRNEIIKHLDGDKLNNSFNNLYLKKLKTKNVTNNN